MPASSLVLHHLGFTWPSGEVVFADLDAAFPTGRTGLVGANGTGKTTLLRILVGELPPTAGSVSGGGSVGYLPQQLNLDTDSRVADLLGVAELFAALDRAAEGVARPEDFDRIGDRWDAYEHLEATLAPLGFAGLDLERRVGSLSGGETVLLALAGLMLATPDVLVLDEPTNNLDRDGRGRLRGALERWRGPAIVVSHDRELLMGMDQIAELRDGELRMFGGNFSDYQEALDVEQQAALRTVRAATGDLKRQQRELAEMRIKLDRRQRFARSQAENVPKIVAGAKKRAAQVSAGKLRGGHEADVAAAREALDEAETAVRDDDLIRIELPATALPAGRGVAAVEATLRNGVEVSFTIRGPERIGLVGGNGAGKTTLIETLLGRVPVRSGRVAVTVQTRLLPQRLQLLDDHAHVLEAVKAQAPSADTNTLRAELARFLLDADTVLRPVRTLSGGERFRATLAALLLAEPAPQLLILDEPTNSLDLDSVAQLTAALGAYRGALLVASHDEPFLAEIGLTGRLELPGRSGRPASVVGWD